MIGPEAVPVLPRGVRLHWDKVRQAWVLLAPERTIVLDEVGHAILSRVDGVHCLATISLDLAEVYGAPVAQIAEDAAGFLTSLQDRRVLDVTQ